MNSRGGDDTVVFGMHSGERHGRKGRREWAIEE